MRPPEEEKMLRKIATRRRPTGVCHLNLVVVKCAYCRGRGKDPFGVPSRLSSCGVCGGSGVVQVEAPYHACAFCSGTGIRPHSRLNCTACKGVGVIHVKEPLAPCPACGGEGRDHRGDLQLYCTTCGGAGVVTKEEVGALQEGK
jgi:DnaJ-class molecular chaperone